MTDINWQARYTEAMAELIDLRQVVKALEESRAGDHSFLQRKVWDQRVALRRIQARLVAQRFVLRTLDGLGRSLTKAERDAALGTDPKAAYVDADVLASV